MAARRTSSETDRRPAGLQLGRSRFRSAPLCLGTVSSTLGSRSGARRYRHRQSLPRTLEHSLGSEDRRILEHSLTRSWLVSPDSPRVQPGDIVLEIGAWLGAFTRFALDRGAKLVVAFEPQPANRSCFEQNFADEIEQGRVVVIAAAAWNRAGPVRLANIGPLNPERSRKGFAVAEDGPIEARSVTIDETVERLGLDAVNFINLDIEGGERHALSGATRTIRRFRPVIVSCIHHLPGDRERIPKTVLEIEPRYDVQMTDLQGFFRPIPEERP